MSYSFTVKVDQKAKIDQAVRDELVKVVAQQPIHEKDAEQAQAAVKSMVDLLADDDSQDVLVSVSGYLSWIQQDGVRPIQSASVTVTASLHRRRT